MDPAGQLQALEKNSLPAVKKQTGQRRGPPPKKAPLTEGVTHHPLGSIQELGSRRKLLRPARGTRPSNAVLQQGSPGPSRKLLPRSHTPPSGALIKVPYGFPNCDRGQSKAVQSVPQLILKPKALRVRALQTYGATAAVCEQVTPSPSNDLLIQHSLRPPQCCKVM